MELKIGKNIRHLRRAKGMTQEQLAQLLHVSCAAVSKWESGDTNPDITMLIPLSQVFRTSVDALLGNDDARIESEISEILETYRQLRLVGEHRKARDTITKARTQYPNDYRIMGCYMWDLSGGKGTEDPAALRTHQAELAEICDCILTGCTEEPLRLEALTMRAKLCYAGGDPEAALELLSKLPSWGQSAELKKEQLFPKDTPEHRYWLRRNLYSLADIMANKLVRSIWYEETDTQEARLSRCEVLGDAFAGQEREAVFAILAHMVFAELAGSLIRSHGEMEDILRIQRKRLHAARRITEMARTDEVLRESVVRTYKTDDLTQWTVRWLAETQHPPFAQLRENRDYVALLRQYDSRC